jgi:putative PIN family toxin of toxin-antitoxin system
VTSAVLDANVLASGVVGFLIPDSVPGQLLARWRARQFELVVSEHLLGELDRTLHKPYFRERLTDDQIARIDALLRRRAALTLLTAAVQGVATHPEDDLVLATAVSVHADYLVTGDKKLQRLAAYQGIAILAPRAFLAVLGRQEAGGIEAE